MAKFKFKKVRGERVYKAWNTWEIGDYVVGTFKELGEDKFGNPNYILEVIESSIEEAVEGKDFCLNSNGSLNYKMDGVAIGSIVRIEYEGETLLEKGSFAGKTCHTVDLQVADLGDMAVSEADLPEEDSSEEDYEL